MTISITHEQRITWSLAEISAATGLSENFLRYEVRRGNLRIKRFGRRVLVGNEELHRYLENGSGGGKRTEKTDVRCVSDEPER